MQFTQFLKSQNLSITEVARDWGVSPSTLSRPCNGLRWPSELVLVRAFELSGGLVSLPDWIENCRPLLEKNGIIQTEKDSSNGS